MPTSLSHRGTLGLTSSPGLLFTSCDLTADAQWQVKSSFAAMMKTSNKSWWHKAQFIWRTKPCLSLSVSCKEPEAFLLRALGSSWRQHHVGCQCGALLISRAESELREPAEGLVPYSAGQLHAQNRVPHGDV